MLSGTRTVEAAHRIADLLRLALPYARHERVEGAGHMGPVTHAPAVFQQLRSFVYSLE